MSRQHTSAARQQSHAAGQQKIVHYCSCGMAPRGNAAWFSHTNAHRGDPAHRRVTYSQFLARKDEL